MSNPPKPATIVEKEEEEEEKKSLIPQLDFDPRVSLKKMPLLIFILRNILDEFFSFGHS